jgi:hypothetical protein
MGSLQVGESLKANEDSAPAKSNRKNAVHKIGPNHVFQHLQQIIRINNSSVPLSVPP